MWLTHPQSLNEPFEFFKIKNNEFYIDFCTISMSIVYFPGAISHQINEK